MSEYPIILITNDDGYDALGIRALEKAFRTLGTVYVVAPDRERSGASQSITLAKPIKIQQVAERSFIIDGTPTDCVLYALRKFLPRPPDWVLSGVNRGANLGEDILYSGTVGAASCAASYGIKAMAVSLDGFDGELHMDCAARQAAKIFCEPIDWELFRGRVVNVNVPNLPENQIRGCKVATLGYRKYSSRIEKDPNDASLTWYSREKPGFIPVPGTDCSLVDEGYVSLSILKPTLFDETMNGKLMHLLQKEVVTA